MHLQLRMHLGLLLILMVLLSSCAVHYYNPDTQIEHVWGIGHMKMKLSEKNEGLQAVIHGTEVLGVSIGKADKHGYFTVGWQRLEFIDVVKESTAVRLEWPTNDFVNVRIGSKFPGTDISPFEFQSNNRDLISKFKVEMPKWLESEK